MLIVLGLDDTTINVEEVREPKGRSVGQVLGLWNMRWWSRKWIDAHDQVKLVVGDWGNSGVTDSR